MNRADRRRQSKSAQGAGAPAASNPLDAALSEALALHQRGRLQEADAVYRRILLAKADHPAALHFRGLLFHQAGESETGLKMMEAALRLAPKNADFLSNMGAVLNDMGRRDESAAAYEKALKLRPDFPGALNNLGVVEKLRGRHGKAIEVLRRALKLKPYALDARTNLANALKEIGRMDEAADAYRAAIALAPADAELRYALAMTLTEKGDLEGARKAFRETLEKNPGHGEAWLMLSSLKRFSAGDPDLAAMQALLAASESDERNRMVLSFGLAKAAEDLGDFAAAAGYLKTGNALRRKTFDFSIDRARADFEAMKAVFTPDLLAAKAGSGLSDDRPVFIVGMPRSGTTLIEQILSAHPDVHGSGELEALKRAVEKGFPLEEGSAFPQNIAAAGPDAFKRAARAYLDALPESAAGAKRVTDKMPGNFVLIGLIRLMLPEARIVHCARDAAATCLSIYKTYFRADGHHYAYDMGELAAYHNLYEDMMDHWRKVLPGVVHEVRYEDFVADQEAETRKLVAWCGLDWNDACLEFHKAKRPVRTASAGQVRQPMYKGSVDLWRNYEGPLAPLFAGLREPARSR